MRGLNMHTGCFVGLAVLIRTQVIESWTVASWVYSVDHLEGIFKSPCCISLSSYSPALLIQPPVPILNPYVPLIDPEFLLSPIPGLQHTPTQFLLPQTERPAHRKALNT